MTSKICKHISITGIVQGVGFRPFVYSIAKKHKINGWVKNTSGGVEIDAEGLLINIDSFINEFNFNIPPLARIDNLTITNIEIKNYKDFIILQSKSIRGDFIPISPDVSICEDCLEELFDKSNRRYLYPFINCTNCGPRFTIIKDVPYDRPNTTMAEFEMCGECHEEYNDPLNRRFHAQPIACPTCGPNTWLSIQNKIVSKNTESIIQTQQMLRSGKIIAIKGLGGFHLACNALEDKAVMKLRERKLRVDKPYAVMMPNIETVETHCYLNDSEKQLLLSRERPIVVLKKKPNSNISLNVSPNQNTLGVMLPYTPLHYLLFYSLNSESDKILASSPIFSALIMTSGNLSEEPIAYTDEQAISKLKNIADGFLFHNRAIHIRCDDSVTRVISLPKEIRESGTDASEIIPIRRSRGYAPDPINLDVTVPQLLAVGAELKNTFCLTRDNYAFVSHHIGDIKNYETYKAFEKSIEHYQKLFRIKPEIIVHDKHPDYLSTQYALEKSTREGLQIISVQHHHAHIASCMTEHQFPYNREVIGVAFDGTGYGDDRAIWGGEFFINTYQSYSRIFHLDYVPLIGGDAAIKEPWRMALSWLSKAGIPWHDDLNPIKFVHSNRQFGKKYLSAMKTQLSNGTFSIPTSSMGRLFDAVSSLIDIRQEINYEAQAAIELEACSDPNEVGFYEFLLTKTKRGGIISANNVLSEIVDDTLNNVPAPKISAKFHNGLAKMVLDACLSIKEEASINDVFLSGGVWQNVTLLRKTIILLESNGFTVYTQNKVPPNDGGISLGQVLIAASIINQKN